MDWGDFKCSRLEQTKYACLEENWRELGPWQDWKGSSRTRNSQSHKSLFSLAEVGCNIGPCFEVAVVVGWTMQHDWGLTCQWWPSGLGTRLGTWAVWLNAIWLVPQLPVQCLCLLSHGECIGKRWFSPDEGQEFSYCLSPPSKVDHIMRIPPFPCRILGNKNIKNHKWYFTIFWGEIGNCGLPQCLVDWACFNALQ